MFAAEFEPAEDTNRRRALRKAAALDTEMDRGGLSRALCRVLDISVHGARLQTYTSLRRGSDIWLRLPQVGEVAAHVVWATDFAAGCQFEKPLAPEAFEILAPLT
ncbi:PilZ domain-containing protein [Sphingomonas sanguinis]|uniref:Pilus assembly protein PilZ n=1 Tax=Sphingomonas sanguinis TaxID=33051 RepID=A0A147I200_9SPHN|nr:PilZ domain-containing protein [Sphingomonas sanguinis]KTT71646.1 pilus assembly protein PilZ [Sphingomonas sanguinis]